MNKRGTATKRARIFDLPGGNTKSTPAPAPEPRKSVAEQVQTAIVSHQPALVSLEVQEHEAAYLVGALIDAQRAAEHAQQQWAEAGNTAQAGIFAAKARACAALASRVARALTTGK